MRAIGFALIVLLLAVLVEPVPAQQAERPDVKVGDQWQFAVYYTATSTKPNRALIVVGYEKVQVPAGEFEAFKLTSKASLSGVSPINSQYGGDVVTTYWYAPAARAVVRSVSHNPYLGPINVDLVQFQLQP